VAPVPRTVMVIDSLATVEVNDAVIVTVDVSVAILESVAALSVTAVDPATSD
jgi:hypothetical protein